MNRIVIDACYGVVKLREIQKIGREYVHLIRLEDRR